MKEASRFYSSLALLVLLNAVVKPIWIFGIDRQVQNEVGAAGYGTYFSILNLSIVLGILLDLGLTNLYNRQLAINDNSLLSSAGNLIVFKLILALLYVAVMFSVAYFTGIKRWDIIAYVILIQFFTSLFVFFRSIVTAQQWFRADAWLSVLDKLLMVILCGMFLYLPMVVGPISIERFMVTQIVCTALATLTAIVIILRRNFRFSFGKDLSIRKILRSALPFALVILLMSFHSRIDGFLLDRMVSAEEAGVYAGAFRLLDAANMLGYLCAAFLLPYIARHWSRKENIESVVLNMRHLLVVFAITLSCIVIFFAPWIQQVLYRQEDAHAIEVMRWCLPAFVGYALVQVYGTVLTATGNLGAFGYITLGSVVINVTLNVLLIPRMGATGSGIAAITSQLFSGIIALCYVKKKLNLAIGFRSIVIYIFIAAVICGFLYLFRDENKWMLIGATGIIVLSLLYITRLFDLKSWIKTTARQ